MEEKYYTYVLIDPRTSQPFYVGKGTGRRMYDHWKHRRAHRVKNWKLKSLLCELSSAGLKPIYNKVLDHATHTDAIEKEKELIKKYGRLDVGNGILCNLTDGGDGVAGWSLDMRTARRLHELSKNKGRPVSQYSITGDLINTYPSSKRAAECVAGSNRSYITQCCKGKRQTSGGFLWAYADDPVPVYHHARCPPVDQYTTENVLVASYVNSAEAAKAVGASARLISSACTGRAKTCYGYIWKYKDV